MYKILISVILPVKNSAATLSRAINSILNQSFKNFELIVVDDNSSDGSYNIAQYFTKVDKRVRLISNTGNGLVSALNLAISKVEGKYIARMDSDDISLPDRLQKQLHALTHHNYDLVGSKVLTFNSSGFKRILPFKNNHDLIIKYPWKSIDIPHPSWMAKANVFKDLYSVPEFKRAEDQDFLLRRYRKFIFYNLDEILLLYNEGIFSIKKRFQARTSHLRSQLIIFYSSLNFFYITLSLINYIVKLIFDLLLCSTLFFSRFFLIKEKNNNNNNFSNYNKFL